MSALKRKDAPVESTWGREAVYASWEDWQAEYDVTVAEMVGRPGELAGHVGANLRQALRCR